MKEKRIGFGLTGSFCTIPMIFGEVERLVEMGAQVTPILSHNVAAMDTRFGTAAETREKLFQLTGRRPLATIDGVEPIGPQRLLDLMIVAPCTGNTMAKLANGIADTPVTMAVKSHLRNGRPVLLAIASNDSLGANARNIGTLMAREHIYFVPFGQDGVEGKPNSMQSRFSLIPEAAQLALTGKQMQPVLLGAGECLK